MARYVVSKEIGPAPGVQGTGPASAQPNAPVPHHWAMASGSFGYEKMLHLISRNVKEVIDIGVHTGTPTLYNALPGVRFVLVDPMQNAEARLQAKPGNYTYLNIGVSNEPGHLELSVDGAWSSFLTRTQLTTRGARPLHRAEVQTLDWVIENHLESDAIGVKVDVEGFEGQVVEGLKTQAHRVRFIILEASILRRFEGAADFSELSALLLARGFHLYNIMNPVAWPAPRYYDAVFLRKDDPLFAG